MSSAHPSGKPNSRHTTRHPRRRSLDRRRHPPNCSTSRGDSRRHRSAHVPRGVDSARIKKIRDHRARDRRNRGRKPHHVPLPAPSGVPLRSSDRSPSPPPHWVCGGRKPSFGGSMISLARGAPADSPHQHRQTLLDAGDIPKRTRALGSMRRLRRWPTSQERVANHLAPVACNANRLVHAGGS